jgi:hypothetical protein
VLLHQEPGVIKQTGGVAVCPGGPATAREMQEAERQLESGHAGGDAHPPPVLEELAQRTGLP